MITRSAATLLDAPGAASRRAGGSGGDRTLIVPFPPGGSTDFTARLLADALQSASGKPVAVETVTGNLGIDALRRLKNADPERTFLVGNVNTNSLMPVVHREQMDFSYDGAVLPVSRLAEFPSVLITRRDFPADSLAAFLSRLKADAGRMSYSTDFLGTYVDVDAIVLGRAVGLDVVYRVTNGALGILADVEAGRIDLALLNVATASANRDKVKPLAVTAPARLRGFPELPTMAEAGFSGVGTSNWQGLFASAKAPKAVVAELHKAALAAMHTPQVTASIESVDARVATSASPDSFATEIRQEMRNWEEMLPAIKALHPLPSSN